MKGQRAGALKHWRLALKQEPDNVKVLNDLAWLMATSPDAALRNGSEAVALASRAVTLTQQHEPMLLGTLAAAYAEAGDFDKAAETQQKAVELANQQGNARLASLLQGRLALLQGKTPIRQQ
jgi:Flp pilus assembly protein TadD